VNAKHKGAVQATLAGVSNAFRPEAKTSMPLDTCRVDDLRCLITGANSGLGKAVAARLAAMGASLTLAVRTMDKKALEDIVAFSGNRRVEMRHLDLGLFDSVNRFVDDLVASEQTYQIVILNAAVVTAQGERTADGLDRMVQVNLVSNVLLLERMLRAGLIRGNNVLPRIVVVSSEAHRWSAGVELDQLGAFRDFGIKESLQHYSDTKFMMAAYLSHLSQRLEKSKISVFALCPGAVNSNLARHAPFWSKPLLKIVFTLFFADPMKAAIPAVYLAGSTELEGKTDLYFHMRSRKTLDERARNPDFGHRLTERILALLKNRGAL
jgi:NAD(P)-dependent dehydrogenase (short-subunit alcohol dehydrogenase family)